MESNMWPNRLRRVHPFLALGLLLALSSCLSDASRELTNRVRAAAPAADECLIYFFPVGKKTIGAQLVAISKEDGSGETYMGAANYDQFLFLRRAPGNHVLWLTFGNGWGTPSMDTCGVLSTGTLVAGKKYYFAGESLFTVGDAAVAALTPSIVHLCQALAAEKGRRVTSKFCVREIDATCGEGLLQSRSLSGSNEATKGE
jgi:hypothetical protein